MSSGRGKGGRTGIAGNVNVALEKSDGTNTPLPADDEGLLIAKLFGEDNNGNDNPISTDSKGRLTVKQSDSNRIIQGEDSGGSVQPVATDSAGRIKVKDIQFDGTVDIGDLQILDDQEQIIHPATEGTLSTIETNTSGLATETTLSTIETNTNGLFEPSDFTEDRNVRELQNETGLTSGTDTGGGSLPSNTVPDGRTVRVQALTNNGAPIQVDGNFELVAGQAVDLGVDNTDKISYTADAGDGVCFIVEA